MEDPLRSPSTRRKVHSVWYVTDKHRYHKVFLCKGAAQTWLERQKSLEPDGRAGVRVPDAGGVRSSQIRLRTQQVEPACRKRTFRKPLCKPRASQNYFRASGRQIPASASRAHVQLHELLVRVEAYSVAADDSFAPVCAFKVLVWDAVRKCVAAWMRGFVVAVNAHVANITDVRSHVGTSLAGRKGGRAVRGPAASHDTASRTLGAKSRRIIAPGLASSDKDLLRKGT